MGAKSIFIHFLICKLKKNVCCEKKRGMGGKFDKGLLMFGLFNHTHASLFTCNIHVAYISIVTVHNQTITIIAEFFLAYLEADTHMYGMDRCLNYRYTR